MTSTHPSKTTKLAVVGAGGVGSATAYAAVLRNTAEEVVLYDIAAQRAEAEGLDIAHAAQFASSAHVRGGGDIELVKDADMIIVTAGARQQPGQSRRELAGANVRILQSMLPQLMEQAPDAVLMLVTNPCDVLAVVAQEITGLPTSRVFASGTVLDSARLKWLISEKAGVATQSVHAVVLGEHGDSEFPLWSQANIGQVPLDEWPDENGDQLFTAEVKAELARKAMRAAYEVIEGKGSTNYAIGLSGARIAEAVLQDQQAVLPVATRLSDYHGVDGIALSVPSVVGAGGVQRVLQLPMTEAEEQQLQSSAAGLKESLTELGF